MQEQSRYAVGIDVGTKNVRCVIGYIDADGDAPKIVGVGTAPNSGMRKGTVTNLAGPAEAIDTALGAAERMSGRKEYLRNNFSKVLLNNIKKPLLQID